MPRSTVTPEMEQQHLYPPGWVELAQLIGATIDLYFWPFAFWQKYAISQFSRRAM